MRVYQCQLTSAQANEVNSAGGWDEVDFGKAYLDATAMFGKESGFHKVEAAYKLYSHTKNIDTSDPNVAFEIGNGFGAVDKITWERPSKSISVGDVLIDSSSRKGWIIKSFGFEELDIKQVRTFECNVITVIPFKGEILEGGII